MGEEVDSFVRGSILLGWAVLLLLLHSQQHEATNSSTIHLHAIHAFIQCCSVTDDSCCELLLTSLSVESGAGW